METKRPVTLKIAVILLLVLTTLNVGAVVAQQYGWRMPMDMGRGARLPQPGQDWNESQPRDEQRLQNRPNLPQGRVFRTGDDQAFPAIGQRPLFFLWLRVERLLRFWGSLALLALAILAAVGVWKGKSWGAALAVILAVLVLLTALFGVFPTRSLQLSMPRIGQTWWLLMTFGINVVKALLALAVIILVLLPSSRQAYRTSSLS